MKEKVTLIHLKWDSPDIEWSFTTGGGPGGQNQNKRATKVRCTHTPSGATGVDASTRHQHTNRVRAWKKMAESSRFQSWARVEAARRAGRLDDIDSVVEAEMKKIRVEKRVNGKWIEWKDCEHDDTLEDAP